MKVRVLIDVCKPLKKVKRIKKSGGILVEVNFKYERSEIFCYVCGMMWHVEESGQKFLAMKEDDGAWSLTNAICITSQQTSWLVLKSIRLAPLPSSWMVSMASLTEKQGVTPRTSSNISLPFLRSFGASLGISMTSSLKMTKLATMNIQIGSFKDSEKPLLIVTSMTSLRRVTNIRGLDKKANQML